MPKEIAVDASYAASLYERFNAASQGKGKNLNPDMQVVPWRQTSISRFAEESNAKFNERLIDETDKRGLVLHFKAVAQDDASYEFGHIRTLNGKNGWGQVSLAYADKYESDDDFYSRSIGLRGFEVTWVDHDEASGVHMATQYNCAPDGQVWSVSKRVYQGDTITAFAASDHPSGLTEAPRRLVLTNSGPELRDVGVTLQEDRVLRTAYITRGWETIMKQLAFGYEGTPGQYMSKLIEIALNQRAGTVYEHNPAMLPSWTRLDELKTRVATTEAEAADVDDRRMVTLYLPKSLDHRFRVACGAGSKGPYLAALTQEGLDIVLKAAPPQQGLRRKVPS